jgi:formylmethanofuran dehydrogenase subunit E-like metal-binding protein
LINNRVSELNDEKESYRKKLELAQQGNSEKINKRMEQVVSDLVDMTGIEFSAKNKETVLARLKNGEIQKEIAKDPGYYQMLGYLHKQTDEKRTAIWKDLLQNQSKSQYHAGIKKVLDQAYGVDKGGGSQSSGEAKNDWTKLKTR